MEMKLEHQVAFSAANRGRKECSEGLASPVGFNFDVQIERSKGVWLLDEVRF